MENKKNNFESSKLKFLCSQIYSGHNIYWNYTRQIRSNSLTGHLKAISIAFKNNLVDDSENVYNVLKTYANYKNKTLTEDNVKEIVDMCVEDYRSFFTDHNSYNDSVFIDIVNQINNVIRTINRQIESIRSTYGVAESKDERFGKTNPLEIYQNQYGSTYPFDEDFREFGSEPKKVDPKDPMFTAEAGKNACKTLNSLKCDILNNFNKTFGDKSVFAALKLSDIIIK